MDGPSQDKLQIGIIGAGIAGLSAAIALRRAGHIVEVYEKSQFKNEVGAAITVGCNATHVLEKWGLDFEKWGAIENQEVRMPHGKTLEPLWVDSFEDVPLKYGHKWLFFHRQDLHNGLRELAEEANETAGRGVPAKLHLAAEVVEISPETGSFKLNDGTEVKKDLLIIANGIHGTFSPLIDSTSTPLRKTGKTVFRCLIPMSKVLSSPLTAQLWESQRPGLLGPNIPGHDIICAQYPCRNNEVLNVAYLHPTKPEEMDKDDWNSPAALEDVEAVTRAFHPSIQALPRMAEDIKTYNMMFRVELGTFVKGRTVLVGDAAHPMLTYHAQGASMSIESTGALFTFFNIHSTGKTTISPSSVATRLEQFNTFRHPRCVTTQIMSNIPHGPAAFSAVVPRIRKYYDGPLPPAASKPWSAAFREFFFGYDVFAKAEEFLEQNCGQ